ncbi:aspartic peptidase domain-containing protein [Multifurca ochricompacta]|uniref:Aspartic peptidase domain-containing protein n=1 Tax=Multifurca ochricompacta TaxID=376703 RepID=A0AAD4M328_9AGAM|nr:aspartic peptidase domain-containing protein [Multifurca ochricompacta]
MEVASDDPDQAGRGLIGLGPNSASLVYAALGNQSSADSPFDRIFREYPSTPQFFTFQLGRHILTVGDQKNTGELTLGSVLPQYQNVTNQPKVEIFLLPDGFAFYQHWLISLDPNGIIGPNGPIKLKSNITHNETLVSLVDTGFTLAQLPHDAASEIYSGLKGAKLENITALGGEVWTFDCDQAPNVTISLGGQLYPVHPLDSSRVFIEDNNKTICFGAFQPKIPGANDPTYDMILGEAFLTNAYVLVHYGNLVDSGNSSSTTNGSSSTSTSNSNSNSTDLPYMQFLSLTDAKTAHAEFVEARKKLAPGVKGFYERHKVPILVGSSIAGGVIVLSIIVSLVMRRSRQRAYRHLSAPAPTGDTQMQMPMQMQMQEQHAGTAGFNNTGARYAHHPSSSLSSASPRGS